jgi:hypothetical protein
VAIRFFSCRVASGMCAVGAGLITGRSLAIITLPIWILGIAFRLGAWELFKEQVIAMGHTCLSPVTLRPRISVARCLS